MLSFSRNPVAPTGEKHAQRLHLVRDPTLARAWTFGQPRNTCFRAGKLSIFGRVKSITYRSDQGRVIGPPALRHRRVFVSACECVNSDDDVLRPSGRRTKTCSNEEVREISRRGNYCRGNRPTESKGHYKSHYSGADQLMRTTCKLLKELVDVTGFEPATPCLQSRCSPS